MERIDLLTLVSVRIEKLKGEFDVGKLDKKFRVLAFVSGVIVTGVFVK